MPEQDPSGTPFGRLMSKRGRITGAFDWPVLRGEKPRKGLFVLLSDEEVEAAQLEAVAHLIEHYKLDEVRMAVLAERNLFHAEEGRQLLVRALRDPSHPDMPYATIEELREHLDPETRGALVERYVAFKNSVSPITAEHDPAVLLEKVDALKEAGGLLDWLTYCDSDTRLYTALALANR